MRSWGRSLLVPGRVLPAAAVAGMAVALVASTAPGSPSAAPARSTGVFRHPERPRDIAARDAQFAAQHSLAGEAGVAARLAAYREAMAVPAAAGPALANPWSEVGPKPYLANDADYTLKAEGFDVIAGRTTSLAVDPTNRDVVWIGTAGGGVWRTADAGTTWVPKGDGLPSLAIGAVAVDPANPHVVYVGTGEANSNFDGYYGTGVYRSADDGATWVRVPQNITGAATVFHIEVAGGNVFVATNKGLFRSADGGGSYQDVALPSNAAHTAPATGTFANFVSDVRVKPGTPAEVTAVIGWRAGKALGADGQPQSPGNGLYRSAQSGAPGTWTALSGPTFGNGSSSSDPIGRVSLAYAAGAKEDHNILWAIIEDAGTFRGETFVGLPLPVSDTVLNGVYRSGDDGATWTLKGKSHDFLAAPGSGLALEAALNYAPGIQTWYNQWVGVDPVNPEVVLVGMEEIYQAVTNANGPGLAKWTTVGRYWNTCLLLDAAPPCSALPAVYNTPTTHPDQHAFAFAASGSASRLYVGSDGGAYRQDSGAAGYANSGWTSINDTLGSTQPYFAVMSGDGTVYAGFQDNGTAKITPAGKGSEVFGGDGFDVAVDPDNASHAYEEYTYGAMSVTVDGGRTWTSIAPTLDGALFSTPFEMDPVDKNHLEVGGKEILETTKGVATRVGNVDNGDWKQSFDLGYTPESSQDCGTPTESPLSTCTFNSQSAVGLYGHAVYVGFCGVCDVITQAKGDLTKFHNGIATNVRDGCTPTPGETTCWHKAAALGLPNRYVSDVAVDPYDAKTIYVTLAGYARKWYPPPASAPNVGVGHLFVSHDAGDHFTDISANLPDTPANSVVLRGAHVIVGTDTGVYLASKTGGSFSRLGGGLPNASALDVNTSPDGSHLVVATHGRGVWSYSFGAAAPPLPAPSRQFGGVATAGATPATGGRSATVAIGLLVLAAALVGARRRFNVR
ncbi:MAG: hypothetical protein JWO37_3550 [Acidimicrobiales bacterium]|jgi:hypothetical protein|nr:hypothetical protein [Acidimicrobiales bacterium]